MRITERHLRSVIRSIIKESQMNEMIDMMNFGTSNEVGPSGDIDHLLNSPMPKNSRVAEEMIRNVLVNLNQVNQIIPQSSLVTIPAIGAAFARGMHTEAAIGIGVFIASALFETFVTERVGAESIDGIEEVITYLDKKGHKRKAYAQHAIREILDKEGY